MDDAQFRIVVQRAPGPPQNDSQPGDVDLPWIGLVYKGMDVVNPHVVRGYSEEEILLQAKAWADEQFANDRAAKLEQVYVYDPRTNSLGAES